MEWLQITLSCNTIIDENVLKEKTRIFSERMDVKIDFKSSNGWFEKFKERHGLSFKRLCGESAEVELQHSTDGGKNN